MKMVHYVIRRYNMQYSYYNEEKIELNNNVISKTCKKMFEDMKYIFYKKNSFVKIGRNIAEVFKIID